MKKISFVFGLVLICVVFLSGCLNLSPEALAMANPLIKQFMEQYPNAKITVNHFTQEQSAGILENISAECGNPYITAKEYYRISIDDPDSGLKAIAWIDWGNRSIECAVKYGGGGNKTISKPGEEIKTCKSHAEAKCYGDHVYWFDSCGHVEEKKEYCQYGCENGFCKSKENCTSNAEIKCYEGHVYWYDSCGNRESKKVYCANGCENGSCIQKECAGQGEKFSWVYKNEYPEHCCEGLTEWEAGMDTRISVADVCYQTEMLSGNPVGICIECGNGVCEENENPCNCPADCTGKEKSKYKTVENFCTEGYQKYCSYEHALNSSLCQLCNCTSHYEYRCYEGHVFWYDSCGARQEKKEYCYHGCNETMCIPAQ